MTSRRFPSPLGALLLVGIVGCSLLLVTASVLYTAGILVVPTAGAQERTASGESNDSPQTARVPLGEERENVTLLFGQTAIVDGVVPDLFSCAQNINLNGRVNDNAFLGCQTARISGIVGGDLFFFGETAYLTGTVEGDVYASGEEFRIEPGASVGGNVVAAGKRLLVAGDVHGAVQVGAGTLTLSGSVGRDVDAAVGSLEIEDGARIGGDLRYTTPSPVEIPVGVVAGGVTYDAGGGETSTGDGAVGVIGAVFSHGAMFIGTFLLGITLLRLFRPAMLRSAGALSGAPARGIAYGVVAVVLFSVLCLIGAAFTAGGIPVGGVGRLFALGGLWLAPFYLAVPVTALCFGEWIHRRAFGRGRGEVAALATGLFALQLIGAIPFVGTLAAIGVGCAGIGGMVLAGREEGELA